MVIGFVGLLGFQLSGRYLTGRLLGLFTLSRFFHASGRRGKTVEDARRHVGFICSGVTMLHHLLCYRYGFFMCQRVFGDFERGDPPFHIVF